MKLKPFIAVSGLFALVFFSSMAGYIFTFMKQARINSNPIPLPPTFSVSLSKLPDFTDTSSEHSNVVTDFTETYILCETKGKLGIFIKYANGDMEKHSNYAFNISALPEKDRKALKKGIECQTLQEALQLLEDFTG